MNCKLRRLDLLRSGRKSDCELHVSFLDQPQGKRCQRIFRCHQVMLVSASEEFERMIKDPEFEKNKRVISLEDASPNAYEALLLYIYTYEVCNAVTLDMCGDLMLLAERYKMMDFVDCYIDKLASQDWPVAVMLQIFQLASHHNHPGLMELVGKKILPVATQVFHDNSFLQLSLGELKALMTVLESEGILSSEELLMALKNYQEVNNVRYNDMERFQQFVEVTQVISDVHFEVDGTLVVEEEKRTTLEVGSAISIYPRGNF